MQDLKPRQEIEAEVAELRRRLAELEGVEDINVELVFDPPWSPDQITEEGKKLLGLD